MDGRTREARIMRGVRAELVAHVGGKPSATQTALINRAAWLQLHMALLDERTTTGKPMTEHDSRTYLAWTNTFTRLMRQLGLKGAAQRQPTLQEHIANRAAAQ